MSLVTSTAVNCQVDGLLNVYTYNTNAFFEFERKKQLRIAMLKLAFNCCISQRCMLKFTKKAAIEEGFLDIFRSSLFLPKNTIFAFGVSIKPRNTVGIASVGELIKRVADAIASVGLSKKKPVPIIELKIKDLTIQKKVEISNPLQKTGVLKSTSFCI